MAAKNINIKSVLKENRQAIKYDKSKEKARKTLWRCKKHLKMFVETENSSIFASKK